MKKCLHLSYLCVLRPDRPKGRKDEVKDAMTLNLDVWLSLEKVEERFCRGLKVEGIARAIFKAGGGGTKEKFY